MMLQYLLVVSTLLAHVETLRVPIGVRQKHGKSPSEVLCQPGVLEGLAEKDLQRHPISCDTAMRIEMQARTLGDFIATAHSGALPKSWEEWEHRPYPLTPERIQLAVHPEGHDGAWRRVADKMLQAKHESRKPEITVLGGSMTKGRGLQALKDLRVPWPRRLDRVLSPVGGANVTVLAEGGSGSAWALLNLESHIAQHKKSDIIVIDFSLNDFNDDGGLCCGHPRATSCKDWNPCNAEPNPAYYLRKNSTQKPTEYLGKLVRILLNLPQRPAVVLLETFQHDLGFSCNVSLKDYTHWPVIEQFDLPVVSYKDAVCETGSTHWLQNGVEHAGPHPSAVTHELVAHTLGAALYYQMGQHCGSQACALARLPSCSYAVLHDHVGIKQFNSRAYECLVAPKAFYYADQGNGGARYEGWKYMEDVPGKPGWIAPVDGKKHNISFTFQSAQGVVTVEFLSSYENVGSIRCWLEGYSVIDTSGQYCDINALWDDHSSQSNFITLSMSTPPKPGKDYRLTCESDGSKFKILGVTAC